MKRVLITGASGFLGSNLRVALEKSDKKFDCIFLNSSDYDLTELSQASKMVKEHRPDVVIHLAALSGGIGANTERPADFFFENSLLVTNVFQACGSLGVKDMIYTMGGCSYPNSASSPISEGEMWEGMPQGNSSAYSVAKKMGIIAGQAYEKQYGLKTKVLVPGNLYGKYDNYNLDNSHVIPALIRKFHEAKISNSPKVNLWGTGSPIRDFVYAEDVASIIVDLIDFKHIETPMNLSSGNGISIKELSELVASVVDYKGVLEWDTSKPDGQKEKVFDVALMESWGFKCDTNLMQGLRKSYDWFSTNYEVEGAIRL
ncbi:NAD-dependent epimerase/dehydratase family protein [Candidatus Puniceispirillum marinum]|uniref:GDP-L-fucose synthase n=1 Tax=Puniceispirillum marinum (strain IMCC1322) TaxID=488538 RepID=D5BSI5_PUNMI|nr:NAD-dependent epimerase/dehydratase family protein [Candidatus Puniceispirillum marinum]ADE39232.1 NAD-dependent epimerase/dehydratase [Candidatus Puniceispirillum marinum IMCC1322]